MDPQDFRICEWRVEEDIVRADELSRRRKIDA